MKPTQNCTRSFRFSTELLTKTRRHFQAICGRANLRLMIHQSLCLLPFTTSKHFLVKIRMPRSTTKLNVVYLLESAETPGRSLPSRSSSEAPPPVDTWLILSSTPYLAATVAVSPPPIMTIFPLCAASTAASRTAFVPVAKASNSKTPGGPFIG